MKYLVLYLIIITGLVITGCSHTKELSSEHKPEDGREVNYSLIYYIHADSDYLYHNPDGKPVQENSEVLATAFDVAESARSGEVIIFQQRRERKTLGLFPRRSSRFFHYKNGQLINRINYRHTDKKEAFLTTEAQLMNQYQDHIPADNHQNYFLYFGHEIPSVNGKGYHRSLPEIDVNIETFARGIQKFLLSDQHRFDLVILSTCNNGTPEMAKLLMPFTDAMLASPQNLHLSHFYSGSLALLEMGPGISPFYLGHLMAEQTYERLEETVHTTITLALYNLEDVWGYIHSLTSITAGNNFADNALNFEDNIDCAEIALTDSERYKNGVEIWYKPARFGRQSNQQTHSGWGCKPITEN